MRLIASKKEAFHIKTKMLISLACIPMTMRIFCIILTDFTGASYLDAIFMHTTHVVCMEHLVVTRNKSNPLLQRNGDGPFRHSNNSLDTRPR